MTTISVFGMNDDGFTYTAEYGVEADGLVYWTAMFRLGGLFRGRRSGDVGPVKDNTAMQLMERVMDDIEAERMVAAG